MKVPDEATFDRPRAAPPPVCNSRRPSPVGHDPIMTQGRFVVLEGIDGAGTTTQTQRLVGALRARGARAHATREPSDGPVGTMIRQALAGRLVAPPMAGGGAPGWATMALLFAADRVDHLQCEVLPRIAAGEWVVSDRYDYSSVAYQGVTSGDDAVTEWIRVINGRARRPDLTVVVDVSPAVARERRASRAGAREIYDDDELQSRLSDFYARIESHFAGDRVVHVDGDRDPDAVHAAVMKAVEALDAEG